VSTTTTVAPPLSGVDRDVLTRTLWGEARGEPEAGQIAIVHVLRNRVLARGTTAAAECLRPYQFSCWGAADPNCEPMRALPPTSPEYRKLAAVVDRAWRAPDTVHGARNYFALSMDRRPKWAAAPGREVARIGGHSFWAGVK
jgi:N-acetylmuramoyl-L-alanine amidase